MHWTAGFRLFCLLDVAGPPPVMSIVRHMKRKLSWLIASLAYFGPPVWAFFAIRADRKEQLAGHGWICGTPMLLILFTASAASGLLSLTATVFGIAAFRALPRPRSVLRGVELGLLILPLFLGVTYVALLFCA